MTFLAKSSLQYVRSSFGITCPFSITPATSVNKYSASACNRLAMLQAHESALTFSHLPSSVTHIGAMTPILCHKAPAIAILLTFVTMPTEPYFASSRYFPSSRCEQAHDNGLTGKPCSVNFSTSSGWLSPKSTSFVSSSTSLPVTRIPCFFSAGIPIFSQSFEIFGPPPWTIKTFLPKCFQYFNFSKKAGFN